MPEQEISAQLEGLVAGTGVLQGPLGEGVEAGLGDGFWGIHTFYKRLGIESGSRGFRAVRLADSGQGLGENAATFWQASIFLTAYCGHKGSTE